MSHVDFSRGASAYDRRHGAILDAAAAARLIESSSLGNPSLILDLGAGTGRVAVAFASIGHRVVAIDVARPMLQALRDKAGAVAVHVAAAEGARLPFADARFDAVVLARVLYLMSDWQDILLDVMRVVAPGGCMLHEWGNGDADEEWVQVREKARALFEAAGVAQPFHPGVRDEKDVVSFLARQGWLERAAVSIGPGSPLSLDAFLTRIVDGECSYTWNVPADVQARCLPELKAWASTRFNLARQIPMPREMIWRVYAKPNL
jgi:SAM-dependent methyltransferase